MRTLLLFLAAAASCTADDAPFAPKFYAFQNGLPGGAPAEQAKLLKELGYDGVAQVGSGNLGERIAAYEKAGIRVLSVYLNVNDEPLSAEKIRPLAKRDALVELTVRKMTPRTVEAVRRTAEVADELGIRVALYPHAGFAVATIPQALDLIEKVDHQNLGVMFNLCHYLRNEPAADLKKTLTRTAPHLFAVSTNGADVDGRGWDTLIQPLDAGTFPQQRLLDVLEKIEFEGPVSLQCYAVKGDKRTNLARSMKAWRRMTKQSLAP